MAETETSTADSDLEILHPDLAIEIRGEQIEVREFRFLEGLRAERLAQPIIAGLAELLGGDDRKSFGYAAMARLFAEHEDAFLQLLGMATGRPLEWFESLSDAEGQRLAMAFWTANRGFFTRRVVAEVTTRKALEQAQAERAEAAAVALTGLGSAKSTPS